MDTLGLKAANSRLSALQNLLQKYDVEIMPQWISFSTTSFCNLQCPHCQTHGTEEIHKESNTQTWNEGFLKQLTSEALPYAYEFNLGLNGEPLVSPSIRQRLREFRQYGAKLHLTTNGTLLTKHTVARVIPIASNISVSIDGATELTCEGIRRGSQFKKLLHKIKLLTSVRDLLPDYIPAPDIRLAFTVMASNVKDLPHLVKMAQFLGVSSVDVYGLVIFFSHVENEDLKFNKPLYNQYYRLALDEAKKRKIHLSMPAPFEATSDDVISKNTKVGMITGPLSDDYYQNLVPYKDMVDIKKIESEAKESVQMVIDEYKTADHTSVTTKKDIGIQQKDVNHRFENLRTSASETLQSEANDLVPYCENLFKRTFVNWDGGVSPCCVPGRPTLGNAHKNTIREIYNGDAYNQFRAEFFSEQPPECCIGCRAFMKVPQQQMLNEIDK